jgi:lipoic acid synthetase
MTRSPKPKTPKPPWLKRRLPSGTTYGKIRALIHNGNLHTVCQEAKCPNQWECFSKQTATFLIMGDRCTRNCRFCAVAHGPIEIPDIGEAERVAQAAFDMDLTYVVVTSVTRDDLADGGASCFAEAISAIRKKSPHTKVEVLIPDFQGDRFALETVIKAQPDVLNHNIETVPQLYATVRPEADYQRSLNLFRQAKQIDQRLPTKSGLMLGLGESAAEVELTLCDLNQAGCDMLTLGQYLQPTPEHLAVDRYIPPDEFENWRRRALAIGFREVASGPFVRSSYHADDLYQHMNCRCDSDSPL